MKNRSFHFGLGITSILVIFVILCIVTFSVLSYVSARADRRLSEDVSEKTVAVYRAENLASSVLSDLDASLEDACRGTSPQNTEGSAGTQTDAEGTESTAGTQEAYFAAAKKLLGETAGMTVTESGGNLYASFSETISDTQSLCVTAQILYPQEGNPWYYKVTQWETKYTADWTPDQSVHVIGS